MTALSERMAEKLGLPPGADTQTIVEEVDRLLAAKAESQVNGAVASGTIPARHRQGWLNSFKADHDGTAAALASMAPLVTPAAGVPYTAMEAPRAATGADSDLSDEEASAILWRLGVRAGLTPPKATIRPTIANADGSMWSAKEDRKRR